MINDSFAQLRLLSQDYNMTKNDIIGNETESELFELEQLADTSTNLTAAWFELLQTRYPRNPYWQEDNFFYPDQ